MLTDYIGSDAGIAIQDETKIDVIAKAKFKPVLCGNGPRTYFYVLENAVETNHPLYGCFCCHSCCIPPDMINKTYFDRGPWRKRKYLRTLCCISGNVKFHVNSPKYVFLCMDCPEWFNEYQACHFPSLCGDRVHFTKFDTACCGLFHTHATCFTNCFGLYGIKTGEPIVSFPFLSGLMAHTADDLCSAIESSHASWEERLNAGAGDACSRDIEMTVADKALLNRDDDRM